MPRKGPRPAPPALKLVRGNPGKRPVDPGLQLPPADLVEPRWIDLVGSDLISYASHAWGDVVPSLIAHGVLTAVDLPLVIDYCVARARLRQCEDDVSRNGITVVGAAGSVVRNPALTAAIQLRRLVLSYSSELGLGPSTRGSMKAAGNGEQQAAAALLD